MGVIGGGQQRDQARAVARLAEHQEPYEGSIGQKRRVEGIRRTDGGDGGAADVVADVGDGDVEEAAQGSVVGGAGVRERHHVHRPVPQDRILVQQQLVHQRVRLQRSSG